MNAVIKNTLAATLSAAVIGISTIAAISPASAAPQAMVITGQGGHAAGERGRNIVFDTSTQRIVFDTSTQR
ncbi:hypothetical protein D3C83_243470 [compost metagenome]